MSIAEFALTRKREGVIQREFDFRMGWIPGVVSLIEKGRLEVTDAQLETMQETLKSMIQEKEKELVTA